MMGIVLERPFPTFPDGFPHEVIDAFSRRTGRGVLGNAAASGTEIIQELGDEHRRTGDLDRLHVGRQRVSRSPRTRKSCRSRSCTRPAARRAALLTARTPWAGSSPGRSWASPATTAHAARHDFSLDPPSPNYLDRLCARPASASTASARSATSSPAGLDTSAPTESNAQGIARTIERLRDLPDGGFVFVNLVETDMVWGHRNDPQGFADCLAEFDEELPRLLAALRHGDLLILTSDHGCDPTTPSTDHSREHGLLMAHIVGLPSMGRRHEGRIRRRRRDRAPACGRAARPGAARGAG